MISTEHIISTIPLVIRRRVKFGECDPAGVVYTVAFSEYVISASDIFYGSLFGVKPQLAKEEIGFRTPTRALELDFRSALRPDDEFDMTVSVASIRTRSYVLHVDARTPDGHDVFRGVLTPICIAREERRSIDVPAPFKAALEAYRAACLTAQPKHMPNRGAAHG